MDSTTEHRSIKDLVENLLFIAKEPLSLNRMADSLPYSKAEIAAALDGLQAEYIDRGLRLKYTSKGWEITTDPSYASEIEQFYNLQRKRRLSRQALETLTVIAYNQPLTRAEIESVRGVGTTGTLQTLLECGFIRIVGQRETVGNPFVYGTSDEFLAHFGLGSIDELPPLEFERENLSPPKFGEPGTCESAGEDDDGKVTPVDFGFSDETAEITKNVQQKGA